MCWGHTVINIVWSIWGTLAHQSKQMMWLLLCLNFHIRPLRHRYFGSFDKDNSLTCWKFTWENLHLWRHYLHRYKRKPEKAQTNIFFGYQRHEVSQKFVFTKSRMWGKSKESELSYLEQSCYPLNRWVHFQVHFHRFLEVKYELLWYT